ncbi:MAG: LysM peptidoglycan-binding domain-containing protein [Pseudomonadota bacterium]|nr:LysM peptidoglycan-binding domain-containing protein [Pseudomonadota bacterium]
MLKLRLIVPIALITLLLLNACSQQNRMGGMFDDIKGRGDLWVTLGKGMKMKVPRNGEYHVQKQLAHFRRYPGYLTKMQRNARPYLYMIMSKLKQRGMPLELALIPAIESTYRNQATSPTGASGLWQFIKSTGREYGLTRSHLEDKRRDPLLATDAGLDYLAYLGRLFKGDWELAIASYNGGQGTMMRARKANRRKGLPTDFWSLSVRKETTHYVPRLLALARMIKKPKKYHLKLQPIPAVKVLATTTVGRSVNLREVARAARLDPTQFSHLNARYTRQVTLPNRINQIILPINKRKQVRMALLSARTVNTDSFFKNLRKDIRAVERKVIHKKSTGRTVTHRVKKGETLSGIARKYGVSSSSIKRDNKLKSNTVRIGQKLKIKSSKKSSSSKKRSGSKKRTTSYTVKSGDTLSGIASKFGTSSAQIKKDNNLKSSSVRIGQKLKISGAKSTSKKSSSAKASKKSSKKVRSHKVKPGESLYGISLKYNTSVNAIQKKNGMGNSTSLKMGQTLKIP